MPNIKTNERELASKISEWINEIIKRNNFPFTSASNETYQIKIPKDDKITKQITASYKQYIKNLKKDLEQNAHEKLHD